MTTFLTVLTVVAVVVYGLGVVVIAAVGLLDWSAARNIDDAVSRAGARRFVQSPLWPLLLVGVIARILADAKEGPRG